MSALKNSKAINKTVNVYRNLRRPKDAKPGYSVEVLKRKDYGDLGGKVATHQGGAERVWVTDVNFVVNTAGYERTIRERKKYVHAYVRGNLQGALNDILWPASEKFMKSAGYERVLYNPKEYGPHFVTTNGERAISARLAVLTDTGLWAKNVVTA